LYDNNTKRVKSKESNKAYIIKKRKSIPINTKREPSVKHTIMRRGYYVQYEDAEPLFSYITGYIIRD